MPSLMKFGYGKIHSGSFVGGRNKLLLSYYLCHGDRVWRFWRYSRASWVMAFLKKQVKSKTTQHNTLIYL